MTLKRMDNVLIVVDDLEAAKAFFIELGLKLEGETTVEGPLVRNLIRLKDEYLANWAFALGARHGEWFVAYLERRTPWDS